MVGAVSDLLELVFEAKDAIRAEQLARIWAAAEPGIRLDRVTRVRPAAMSNGDEWHEHWTVEIAYSKTGQETLGL
jgi:hypothetical protein